MKKNHIITLALSMFALPLFAHAQVLGVTVSGSTTLAVEAAATATEAQIMTSCSQAAIDARDSSIGSARTAYNNAMAVALDARKEAEKKAVALTDDDAKKAAIKVAVDNYKDAALQAQDTLTQARKEAWSQFETSTSNCRDLSKGGAKKNVTALSKNDVKAEVKAETKSLKEVIKEQLGALKSLFKIGFGGDASTDTEVGK